ncbi:MAG: hypothetical protein LBJ63_11920 [Prevotellaceae bacterium]|jgi:hypothetical protein|nr:hypothetical protein [Prevotellaceae bacterium]
MKKLLILLLSAILCVSADAQQKFEKKRHFKNNEKPGKEEIIEKKCKKAADKLMLDDVTAVKFAPVYKAYLNELSENVGFRKLNKDGETNDSDIDENVRDSFAKARKTVDIREKYYNEFRKFLTAKQAKTVMKLFDGKRMKGRQFDYSQKSLRKSVKNRLEFSEDKQKLNKEKALFKAAE